MHTRQRKARRGPNKPFPWPTCWTTTDSPPRSTLDRSSAASDVYKRQKPYQEELFYKKPTFEDWKEKKITNEYLTELRNQIEKEL